jgi:hypothetical protein
MDVSKIHREVEKALADISNDASSICPNTIDEYVRKYGYIMARDNTYRALFDRQLAPGSIAHAARAFAAYIDDKMLAKLPDSALMLSRPLLMRVPPERKDIFNHHYNIESAGMWMPALDVYRRGIDYDDCRSIIESRVAYMHIVSGAASDDNLPYMLMKAAKYATAKRLRRMARVVLKRRRHILQSVKGKTPIYRISGALWPRVFANLMNNGYIHALPWQYSVKLAKAMLITPRFGDDDLFYAEFPMDLNCVDQHVLPHHKLMIFLIRMTAKLLHGLLDRQREYVYTREPSARKAYNWLRQALRHGRLSATLSPEARMRIGLLVPRVANTLAFTVSEIKRIRTINKIDCVG